MEAIDFDNPYMDEVQGNYLDTLELILSSECECE